jgi:hypothetical protein
MLPLNHKRTTSSLAPPIFCVAKKIGNKKIEGSPLQMIIFLVIKKRFLFSDSNADSNEHTDNFD